MQCFFFCTWQKKVCVKRFFEIYFSFFTYKKWFSRTKFIKLSRTVRSFHGHFKKKFHVWIDFFHGQKPGNFHGRVSHFHAHICTIEHFLLGPNLKSKGMFLNGKSKGGCEIFTHKKQWYLWLVLYFVFKPITASRIWYIALKRNIDRRNQI